jgi:hypothetical protein
VSAMSETDLIEYTYRADWRTEDPSLPSFHPLPGWRVRCAEHGHLGSPGKVHGKRASAQMVATTHLNAAHAEAVRRYTFTRPELIEAISHLEAYPATTDPGRRVFISAESMADGIIEALETERRRSFRASLRDGGENG